MDLSNGYAKEILLKVELENKLREVGNGVLPIEKELHKEAVQIYKFLKKRNDLK